MCLAVPGKITEFIQSEGLQMCKMDFGGVVREVCIATIPEAQVGDYAIVHAGFALNLVSQEEAHETIKMINEIAALDDEMPAAD